MNNQGVVKDIYKYINKVDKEVTRNFISKKKILDTLIDTQTSLIIHKNLIINLIKELVTNKLKALDEDNQGTELADCLADLLIIKGTNDQVVDKFIAASEEKVSLNKAYYKINYSSEMKRKKKNARVSYFREMCSRIENKLIEKKGEIENKVKDHDKLVTNSSVTFKKEIYIYFPTKINIELYVEKTQGIEILNKLTDIMKAEKLKYNNYQDKIKELIKKISMSSREIKASVDETILLEKDKYSSDLNNYATNQLMLGSVSPVIELDNEDDNEEEELDNYMNVSFDSVNIRFPDKIKPLKINSGRADSALGDVPKLNFQNIHSKYMNDQNVIVKEEKKEGNKLIDEANQILINLLENNKKKDVEVEEYRKEIKKAEKRILDLKEGILMISNSYKINKKKAIRLNESTQNTDIKISKLTIEIDEIKKKIKDAQICDPSNSTTKEDIKLENSVKEKYVDSRGEHCEDDNDEVIDDVNFDLFNYEK